MKNVQRIENYLCLEARVQCCNKWMPTSKDQSFFFGYSVSHTATDDVGLLYDLHGKRLVRSTCSFLLNKYNFPESSLPQNSNWAETVYRNISLSSSSTCLCLT